MPDLCGGYRPVTNGDSLDAVSLSWQGSKFLSTEEPLQSTQCAVLAQGRIAVLVGGLMMWKGSNSEVPLLQALCDR